MGEPANTTVSVRRRDPPVAGKSEGPGVDKRGLGRAGLWAGAAGTPARKQASGKLINHFLGWRSAGRTCHNRPSLLCAQVWPLSQTKAAQQPPGTADGTAAGILRGNCGWVGKGVPMEAGPGASAFRASLCCKWHRGTNGGGQAGGVARSPLVCVGVGPRL